MENGIYADTNTMNAEGKSTVTSSDEFAAEITNLKNSKTELLGIWHGPSAKAFEESADSHLEFMERFQSVLTEMGEKIIAGSNRLATTEEENEEASKQLMDNGYSNF